MSGRWFPERFIRDLACFIFYAGNIRAGLWISGCLVHPVKNFKSINPNVTRLPGSINQKFCCDKGTVLVIIPGYREPVLLIKTIY